MDQHLEDRQSKSFSTVWLASIAIACLVLPALTTPDATARISSQADPNQHTEKGVLDARFGRQGKVVIPIARHDSQYGGLSLGITGEDEIVAGQGRTLILLRSDGTVDREFGHRGRVDLRKIAGPSFLLSGLAIDSRDRIVVSGTTWPTASEPSPPGVFETLNSPPKLAAIIRLLPSGDPDPEFDQDGFVGTDFGFPPPPAPGASSPSVGTTAVMVDPEDRPVIAGTAATRFGGCPVGSSNLEPTGFLARLTPYGSSDTSFHGSGTYAMPGASRIRGPVQAAAGSVLSIGIHDECRGLPPPSLLVSLDAGGYPSPDFGAGGTVTLGDWLNPLPDRNLVRDRFDRIFLGDSTFSEGPPRHDFFRIIRLTAAGAIDQGYGKRGVAHVPLSSREKLGSLTADARGGLLIAGSLFKKHPLSPTRRTAKFLLVRMSANGSLDPRFGRRGRAVVGFGPGTSASASQILVDGRGRAVVAGNVKSPDLPTHRGIALARYVKQ
ncbi:MAG TPA: hypothetical protein VF093_10745 [Solirubrobacterales bacterium]